VAIGDLVLVRVKGRCIYGEVEEISDGTVRFRPLCPAAGWRHASAREIVSHWRKAGRPAARGDETATADEAPSPLAGQLALTEGA